MEALKYLAWHLIYACDELELYNKLASEKIYERKIFVQWINQCLQQCKPIKSVLTKSHLDEISNFLIQADEQQWKKACSDFIWYVLIFGIEKVGDKWKELEE
jgi:DNA modification methylase